MLLALLVQAAMGPVDPASAHNPARRGCKPATTPDEVVVCARVGESRYRLRPLPPREAGPAIPAAAMRLKGGGRVAVEAQQGNVGPIPTKRAVVTLKLPF